MHRKFITLIVAAAIAVTGFSAPARADTNDVGKALAGLAFLAIIGAAIHENRKPDPVVTHNYTPPPVIKHPPHYQRPPYIKPRPLPPQVSRQLLPRSCLRTTHNKYGTKNEMFGSNCLQNTYGNIGNLPRACAQRVQTRDGDRYGYNAQCMQQKGYRMSRK